ncbi:fungal-specific transcription factor domain-containing protein [Thelonectria olida]|uniref:Fungal-specific transcription factor domain-containing protein n=1 Tax=Thelonectria olida TaxID=1576542 RepID=A0A9P9AHS3_9HYPO|nr:fungal-specific transcription factor domain-containing protein [Thelonectria olida]
MRTLPGTATPTLQDNPSADEVPFPGSSSNGAPLTTGHSHKSPTAAFITSSYYRFVDVGAIYELSPHDVTFLEQRGCFHLPARPSLDEFLRQYFVYSHPILPLFNESKFWRMYSSQHRRAPPQNRISLFVLQTMLFVSCPFVSTSILSSLGFQSIQAARRDFYMRAKALFDLNMHKDDVANAQGALLLSYHSPTTTDKVNTYWLEAAIHFARNAHADHYHTVDLPPQDKHVLKRLWWCCILRDRIMSLSFRRPLNIRPDDFEFGQPGLRESDFINEIRGPSVYNAPGKKLLTHMITALCELAAILNGVLTLLYPGNQYNPASGGSSLDAHSFLEKLDLWHHNSKSSLTMPERTLSKNNSLLLFSKMISIYYHTAKASMCHYILLLSIPKLKNPTDVKESCLQSQSMLNSSLQGITRDLKELAHRGLIGYLPNTFVPFLAFPFTWNILQVKVLKTENQSGGDQRDLVSYISAMRTFQSLYEITDSTLGCIENIVTHIKNEECSTLLHQNPFIHHPLSASLGMLEPKKGSGNVWVDLLLENPHIYLRIALTVDFSLAHGQFPTENDMPKAFHRLDSDDGNLTLEDRI